MRKVPRHLAAAAVFVLLAIAVTWPLASHLHDATIGTGIGDNASAIWNFWWIRQVLAHGASPFWTPALFAPIGTSLVLHTTTLAPTLGISALLPSADPLTAYHVALIVTVCLNGFCAYAAAYALTRAWGAAIVAGIIFSASPFLLVRLQGHFNVLSAWGLPLLALAMQRFTQRTTGGRAVVVSLVLALLAYTDYYQLVFGTVFVVISVWLRDRRIDVRSTPLTSARRRAFAVLLVLVALLAAAIIGIAISGGGEVTIAGLHVSARETFNLRGIAWLLTVAALVVWSGPRVTMSTAQPVPWRSVAAGAAMLGVLLLPLIAETVQLIAHQEYASQTYFWRSAPPGIDVGALVLGNPWHPLYGTATRAVYARTGIHPIESAVWLGLVPVACLLYAAIRLRREPDVQRWLVLMGVFFIWSLGPFLMTFGANTGFILPQTVLRFVPLLANARMPGRAFVFVLLGVSMLAARVLATMPRRRTLTAAAAALLVLIDFWPAPQPLVPLERPRVYEVLRAQPAGAVLDLPLGVRDGFGERGQLDHRALFYQTLHAHPIGGGSIARLSPRVVRAYEQDPVLGALLGSRPPGSDDTLACAFRYVMLPKDSPPATRDLLTGVFQLDRIDGDEQRDLYRVAACRR